MARYEERLQDDLGHIRAKIGVLSAELERALDRAVRALLTLDRQLAGETILRDLFVNRTARELDALCHAFVARHLPAAGHLRFISATLRLGVALERIGDYAVTICREAVQLTREPPAVVVRDIEMLAEQARRLFQQSMQAFQELNPDLARGTAQAGKLRSTFDKVFFDLVREGEQESRPMRDLFALLVVFNRLERVSDQSRNICESVVFAVTGEDKAPKVYKVLFVDERNDRVSPMAELYARKVYPASGRYTSAGWDPAPRPDPAFTTFMDEHGYHLEGSAPRRLVTVHEELAEQHVIVDLSGGLRERLPEVPFHTLLLTWPVADDRAGGAAALEALHVRVAGKVRELVEALHGPGAR